MFPVSTKVVGVLATVFLICTLVTANKLHKERLYISEYKREVAAHLLEANNKARQQERASQAAVDELAQRHEERRREEQEVYDSTIADLRSGNARLRNHWQGCQATNRAADSAQAASNAYAEARAREESVARILALGRRYDNWIIGLQEYAREVSE